jgi:hypothetical protein
MSVAIGSGTTTAREARWYILGILLIALLANRAFGTPGKPNPPVRQPKTPVVHVCRVTAGVPMCTSTGIVFPENPNWKAAFGR